MEREVRYCTTEDGVKIAYQVTGEGPPIIRVLGWFTHLEYEWESTFWRHFMERLSDHYSLIRYDGRGTGLSDRDIDRMSMSGSVRDLEAVIEAVGLAKFNLFGISQGVGPAIAYAAEHPDRVNALVAYGGFARGYGTPEEVNTMRSLVLQGWASTVPAHRQFFTGLFMPDNPDAEDIRTFNELQRQSAAPEIVASLLSMPSDEVSVIDRLPQMRVPTVVLHRRNDSIVPFEMGREIAAKIPGARFVPLEGANHCPLPREGEVWDQIMQAVDSLILGEERQSRSPQESALRTVLFTDIAGHTEMMSRLGDTRGRAILREHERLTREVLKAHGGHEVKTMGDGFMASFGGVTKAVECAIALQRAIENWSEDPAHNSSPLHIRVGINAGEPIEEDGDLFGATVILASRIAARADGGEILVADTVRGLSSGKGFLFSDRGEFAAKGFEEPVHVYEVNWRTSA